MAQRTKSSVVHIPPDQTGKLEETTSESVDPPQRRTTITVIAPHDLKKAPSGSLPPLAPSSPARHMAPQARSDHMRLITRPPPGEPGPKTPVRGSSSSSSNPRQSGDFASRRQSWFESNFNSQRSPDSVKQQVEGEAMISADIKTNVIIKDEFTFITDLSYQLAERYQRSITSIVVTVQHGACMLYGGTFDPAYVLNITTLETALSLTVNKRNAALLQGHMDESLGVPPTRGLINFVGIKNECAATNGKTIAGMVDEAARSQGAAPSAPQSRPGTSGSDRRRSHRLSTTFGANLRRLSTLGMSNSSNTPPTTPSDAKFPHSPTTTMSPGMASVTEEVDETGSRTRDDRSMSKSLSSRRTTVKGVEIQPPITILTEITPLTQEGPRTSIFGKT